MKSCLTIQEKLKDLRVEKGLNLEELAAATLMLFIKSSDEILIFIA